ncbi:MAG: VWA domain-containing protein, partial [Verrucomicrobiota bacterium]
RVRAVDQLAFGPGKKPHPWAWSAPFTRAAALGLCAWGLMTLLLLPPHIHRSEAVPMEERKHVVLALDVSPSMRLQDAGPSGEESRMARARHVMESFFDRVPPERYLVSVVAFYTGAKPVVVDTSDMEVVRNILGDLPMHYAFKAGKTDLFAGLEEAATLMRRWKPGSTTVIVVSDGDTVPPTGTPRLPASTGDVLVVGVGDPLTGSFIDGGQSRQDATTLRQLAVRLGGVYHNGNAKHLPSDLLTTLTVASGKSPFERLTRREYALIAVALGSTIMAFLPVCLHYVGTAWKPGVASANQRSPLPSSPATLTRSP